MVDQQVLRQQIPKTNKDSGTVTGDWQGSVLDVPSLVAPAEAGAGGFSEVLRKYFQLLEDLQESKELQDREDSQSLPGLRDLEDLGVLASTCRLTYEGSLLLATVPLSHGR